MGFEAWLFSCFQVSHLYLILDAIALNSASHFSLSSNEKPIPANAINCANPEPTAPGFNP